VTRARNYARPPRAGPPPRADPPPRGVVTGVVNHFLIMKRKGADTTSPVYVSKRLKQTQEHQQSTEINISDLSPSKVSPPRELPAAPPDSPAPNAERGVHVHRFTTGVFECVKTKLIVRFRVRTSDAVLWTLETTNAELTHGWANVQPHDDGGEILAPDGTLTGKYAELNGILAKNLRSPDDKSESLSTRRISEE
tara:strand:- start:3650 stop:4234 length:585 start_codon:yes stop_codon:yes gene_type:complete